MTTEIKRVWATKLSPEEQAELLLARAERDRTAAREYGRRNKVKTAARKYGVSEETLQSLIDEANGYCTLCTGPLGERLHIDHCHTTGKVRSILCGNCNNGLGQFKDNPSLLRKAADYLESYMD